MAVHTLLLIVPRLLSSEDIISERPSRLSLRGQNRRDILGDISQIVPSGRTALGALSYTFVCEIPRKLFASVWRRILLVSTLRRFNSEDVLFLVDRRILLLETPLLRRQTDFLLPEVQRLIVFTTRKRVLPLNSLDGALDSSDGSKF